MKIKEQKLTMEFIDEKTIRLSKVVNELDKFVIRFIRILEKHAEYVIVSGYVAILFGRSRATEDIDVFIKELSKKKFNRLCNDLKKNGYWCLNTDDVNESYEYLIDGVAVRFALKNETTPNFEVKFAKKKLSLEALKDTLTVVTKLGNIRVSSIERQIAFKRYFLKSQKDLEDATHMEELFKEHIDFKKVEHYKKLIQNEKT